MKRLTNVIFLIGMLFGLIACGPKWIEIEKDGFNIVTHKGGQTLG